MLLKAPDIAVVIPALNGATHLRTALSGLAVQDASYEAVLIDSGSRDDTVEFAAKAGVRLISAPGTFIYEAQGALKNFMVVDSADHPPHPEFVLLAPTRRRAWWRSICGRAD
jgi:glycosyltransferase involved in cell wall biosynthesis